MSRRKRKSSRAPRLVKIYEHVEEMFARKGPDSLWPNTPFRHTFQKGAHVLGVNRGGSVRLKKGDLVIRSSRGKRLWQMFEY